VTDEAVAAIVTAADVDGNGRISLKKNWCVNRYGIWSVSSPIMRHEQKCRRLDEVNAIIIYEW
jgi:hypothetical protein